MTDIPQWAEQRALELMRAESSSAMWSRDCYADRALARYIAEHEEPPVDPLIKEMNLIVDQHQYTYDGLRDAVLAALRRGMELAK